MPLPIQEFYKDKSVVASYNFSVTVIHDDSGNSTYLPNREKIPELKNYHILGLQLPQWEFKKEVMYYGPYVRTFPVLNSDGFEFTMTLEEDDKGTVSSFINYLQRKIIKPNGTYVAPKRNRINQIYFSCNDMSGSEIFHVSMDKCYYLKASNPEFSYGNNDSIKYDITFNCDFHRFFGKI